MVGSLTPSWLSGIIETPSPSRGGGFLACQNLREFEGSSHGRKTLTLEIEKETKNTVRFAEKPGPGTPSIVEIIYVQK